MTIRGDREMIRGSGRFLALRDVGVRAEQKKSDVDRHKKGKAKTHAGERKGCPHLILFLVIFNYTF